jgi:hypothetical protein
MTTPYTALIQTQVLFEKKSTDEKIPKSKSPFGNQF